MSGQHLLLVHHDAATAARMALSLEAAGYVSSILPNGERAIDHFIQRGADGLILSISLPGRDGLATLESLRWAPGGREVPALLIATQAKELSSLAPAVSRLGATMLGPDSSDPAAVVAWADLAFGASTEKRVLSEEELLTVIDSSEDSFEWSVDEDPLAEHEGQEVELRAAQIESAPATLEGDLEELPFPRLLQMLAERRVTGALVLTREIGDEATTTGDKPKKIVFLRAGVPIYVKSNLARERLGQLLYRGGKITSSQRQASAERTRRGEGLQGAILVKMGAISETELRDAIVDQLRVKLFDLFAWTSGRFRVSDKEDPPPENVTLDLGLSELLFEGVARRIPAPRLFDLIEPMSAKFVIPDRRRAARFLRVDLVPEARAVLLSLDGTQRVRALIGTESDRPGAAAQLLYAMECAGAIRYSDKASPTEPLTDADLGGEQSMGDAPLGAAALELEVREHLRLLRADRYEETLGVAAGDVEAATRESERLLDRYKNDNLPADAGKELRALCYEVCARLGRTQGIVSLRRARQSQTIDRSTAARRLPDPSERAEAHTQDLTIDESAATRDPEAARPVPMLGTRAVEDATTPPARPAPPPRPSFTRENVDIDAAVAVLDSFDPSPPTEVDAHIDRIFQAEHYFRRGARALEKERYDDASHAFQKAVDLCPEEGDFIAHLAYARHRSAPSDDRVLEAALRDMARGCAGAKRAEASHVLYARTLKARGDLEAARAVYAKVLEIQADNHEAQRALREL